VDERAKHEKWTSHQKTGVLAQDSCNLSVGIEHDYVINTLVGGDESIRLGRLSYMFQLLAQQIRDANEEVSEDTTDVDDMNGQGNNVSWLHCVLCWTHKVTWYPNSCIFYSI